MEQIFEKEAEGRYPVLTHSEPNNSPYKGSKETFKHGCRYGYELAADQLTQLKEENERLKELERKFYLDICRAFNAGKRNAFAMVAEGKRQGEASEVFISSDEYFKGEFPEFTTNVP